MSPHEECAVEEAVRLVERDGGSVTVLTLGPPEAADQLRDAIAVGANAGHPAVAPTVASGDRRPRRRRSSRWRSNTMSTPACPYDLLLFGNEAADTGDYQIRRPCRPLCSAGRAPPASRTSRSTCTAPTPKREYRGVTELFELPLPAVVSVKEGINLPRYPSLPGRMRAKKAIIEVLEPEWRDGGPSPRRLRVPMSERRQAPVSVVGVEAVPVLVDLLEHLGMLS